MDPKRKPIVLVTGASRGIGLEVTKILLTTFKAVVVSISRSRSPGLQELILAHPSTLLPIDADIADETAVREAVAQAIKTYHHLDALVLNAAVIDPLGRIDSPEISTDAWRQHFNVNFFSLHYTVQAALPALRASEFGGKVVFVSSGAATGGIPTWAPYNASKAAMNSFCRTLATEEPGIVSVSLRPGMVDTDMQLHLRTIGPSIMPPEQLKRFIQAHKSQSLVKPEDAGHVIAALSLKAPKALSGTFVSWDDENCKDFRR